MDEPEKITRLEHVVGMIEKTVISEYSGPMSPISVRLPVDTAAMIDALSQHSGHSKNKLMIELLDLAIEQVWAALAHNDKMAIHKLQGSLVTGLLKSSVAITNKGD